MNVRPIRPMPSAATSQVEPLESRLFLDATVGTVTMPYDGYFSAAIYEEDGTFVRTLYECGKNTVAGETGLDVMTQAGTTINLVWDGLDTRGNVMPLNEKYQWKVLFSRVTGDNDGDIGDSGFPSWGATESNGGIHAVAVDPAGDMYSASWWEESHKELRKYRMLDGESLWDRQQIGLYAVASDGVSVYAARTWETFAEDRIYRINATDGKDSAFTGGGLTIAINTNRTRLTDPYENEPLRGLAVDSSRLWVSNYLYDRLEVRDKDTGALLGQLDVTNPLGVAVQVDNATSGTIWLVHETMVSKYNYTVSGGVYTFTEDVSCRISNLTSPYGLTIGGMQNHLYISEQGSAQRITEWDISGVPFKAGVQSLGSAAVPGPVAPDKFGGLTAIAVDPQGRIIVNDTWNERIQFFNADGTFLRTIFGDHAPSPTVTTFGPSTTHFVMSGPLMYEVDPMVKHEGWMGDGTWRLYANYRPLDSGYYSEPKDGRAEIITLEGRKYLTYQTGSNLSIYLINADGTMRRSAIVGEDWAGIDGSTPGQGGRWTWADSDGDGVIDFTAVSDPNDEITWNTALGTNPDIQRIKMDPSGNIWAVMYGDIVKVPLLGFDGQNNPLYDWSQRQVVVLREAGLTITRFRFAPNRDIYVTASPITGGGGWSAGGHTIRRYDSTGKMLAHYEIDDATENVGAIDVLNDDYWVSAHGSANLPGINTGFDGWMEMWTSDMLKVATFLPDQTSGDASHPDNGNSVCVFTDPHTGKTYIYTEDVFFGRSVRWRVDNLATGVERTGGTFSWDAPVSVSIQATDAAAAETGSDPGVFTVTRTGSTVGDLTVYFQASGSAAAADYGSTHTINNQPTFQHNFDDLNGWTVGAGDSIQNGMLYLGGAASSTSKDGVFSSSAAAPKQQITFSFRLEKDIYDYRDNPTALSFQSEILRFRGPDTNTKFSLWYKGQVDGSANVTLNRLEFQGTTTKTSGPVVKGRWYQVTVLLDAVNKTSSVVIKEDGKDWWKSETVTGSTDTATNRIIFGHSLSAPMYIDDVKVLPDWTPEGFGSVVIPNGSASAQITITPVDDALNEGNETLRLTLAPGTTYKVDSADEDTVVIADSDAGANAAHVFTVSATDSSATEGSDTATFRITRTTATGTAITVKYTVAGTAALADASGLTGTVSFGASDTYKDVVLTAVNDSLVEAAENVVLQINPDAAYTAGSPASASVTINDNDNAQPVVTLTASDATASETAGNPGEFTFTRTGPTTNPLTVNYTLLSNASFSDYSEVLATSNNYDTMFDLMDDGTIDDQDGWSYGTANCDVQSSVAVSGKALLVDGGVYKEGVFRSAAVAPRQRVTMAFRLADLITDFTSQGIKVISNEIMHLRLPEVNDYNDMSFVYRGETNSSGVVTVNQFQLRGSTTWSTTTVNHVIEKDVWYYLTADIDAVARTCKVQIVKDGAVWWTSNAVKGTSDGYTNRLTFAADTDPDVGFYVDNLTVSTVQSAGSGSFMIPAGQSSATLTVTPTDDAIAEAREAVMLTVAPSANYLMAAQNNAVVTILDNDLPTVTIAATDTSASESGDTGLFTFTRNGTGGDLKVYYSTGGTASAADYAEGSIYRQDFDTLPAGLRFIGRDAWLDTDYTNPPRSIVQNEVAISGNALKAVEKPIKRKNVFEPSSVAPQQTVTFSFMLEPLLSGVQHTLMGINGPDENAGNRISLIVYGGRIQVKGATTLTTNPLQVNVWYHVTVEMDFATRTHHVWAIKEGDTNNFFDYTLTGANSADIDQLEIAAWEDPDKLRVNPFYLDNLVVSRPATQRPYVVIPDGQSSVTLKITPNNDLAIEGSEALQLTLDTDATYNIGAQSSGTVTISDNDPTVTVHTVDNVADEAATPGTATFRFSRNTNVGDLTVNFVLSGSATLTTDYTASATTSVVIPAGSYYTDVTITPVDDALKELTENITVTISSSANYTIGVAAAATATLFDNEAAPAALPAPVAYWSFDEGSGTTAYDTAGSVANNGTLMNGAAYDTGKIGTAVHFDGTNDYVEVAASTEIQPTTAITVAAWVKSDTANWNATGAMISKRNAFVLHPLAGTKTVKFYVFSNGSWGVGSSYTLTDISSAWHHYAATYDGTNVRLYVDGVLRDTDPQTGTMSDNGALYIGRDDGTTNSLDALIDEVRLYNTSLSDTQIAALYQLGGASVTNLSVSSPNSADYSVQTGSLATGVNQYGDRTDTFTTIPSKYLGMTYIRTANDDRTSTGDNLMSFDINVDSTVYIVFDEAITDKPLWLLNQFTDTGDNIVTTAGTFSVYKATLSAGKITLGGNTHFGLDQGNMYTVLLSPLT